MTQINIKPLSVNQCWQGVRYKTPGYLAYEKELLFTLPAMRLPEPPYRICFEFGISKMTDVDNSVKPTMDILCKKYGFNDRDVYELNVVKSVVKKGGEYVRFEITKLKAINN